jgi:hypothetical protein
MPARDNLSYFAILDNKYIGDMKAGFFISKEKGGK